jgi:CubicO group peptidase (beta-lactamase class C family)
MKKIIFLFSFIFLSFAITAQQTKISSEVKDHIKARVDNGVNVAIVVGFIDGDSVEFFSYGKTALENGQDVDENSVFEIGSISKTFTTIMLADEILKGNMKLSDPLSKYLPEEVKVPSRNNRIITLKDLATHSSALPRMPTNFTPSNPNNPYADYTIELAYDFMKNLELARDIGELYEYSNFGMGMLGHALELQNNMTYEDLMVERIANVLGMNNTRIVFTKSMLKNLAKGHANRQEVENWDLPALAGAGAIRSTASDMVKYLQANMGIIKTHLYDAMLITHKVAYKNEAQNFEMGLAWHYENDEDIVWHNGGTGGYISFAGFSKRTNKGVVVLTNTTEGMNDIGFKLLDDSRQLEMPKLSIVGVLEDDITTNGITSGIALYKKLKKDASDKYDFSEGELNRLGYAFMNKDIDAALKIFKLNVAIYSEASNPYDSLGEAYLKKGYSTFAITNYKKSLELNPANDNAKKVLIDLGVKEAELVNDVNVPVKVLETYVGKYQLAPTFSITITRKESKLFLQATGQPQFEVFASSQNEFYLKVVEASITFNADDTGKIESLILHQNGQHMPGKKIE